ncbi:MAG: hypothetical protein GC202_14150 [Alphaproteobacteria bacterium]|nr:hypothetical protein [Alphaproteobacteria bacterium]
MTRRRQPAPLLAVIERMPIEEIERHRAAMKQRILLLPRNSHKRLELEGRMAELTRQALSLEINARETIE